MAKNVCPRVPEAPQHHDFETQNGVQNAIAVIGVSQMQIVGYGLTFLAPI